MPYAKSAGAEIYYESQGSGEAILFAHGAGGNAGIWFEQVAAFSDRYQCITFDHRTFARSPADPTSITPVQSPSTMAVRASCRSELSLIGLVKRLRLKC